MARLKVARHRQRIANGLFEALGKNAHETLAFEGIFEPRIKWINVDGQAPLAPHEVIEVFVHGKNIFRIQAKSRSDAAQKLACHGIRRCAGSDFVGDQSGIASDRLTVGAPETVERPARQRFAGIPFALSEVNETLSAIPFAQAVIEVRCQSALVRTDGRHVPLLAFRVIHRYESRFAAHRNPDIAILQFGVDGVTKLVDRLPLFLTVGFGDAGRFPDARDRHLMDKVDLTLVDGSRYRRRRSWHWRAGER